MPAWRRLSSFDSTRWRSISTSLSPLRWAEYVSSPNSKVQSYISTSRDPYLNLSIEHYLLNKTPPSSTVLFLYTNRPCVVIGRNQNPWYEVNLGILDIKGRRRDKETEPPAIGNVELVRRRSGGGAVFHDEGNVNWSIICPPASFTRDKYAEMVVRSLRRLGVDRARVNERHDIVLDQGPRSDDVHDSADAHKTPYTSTGEGALRPLKVSGSAYKLTRKRALHHATCLLSSPNLHIIPEFLRSPVKPYITAKGVESVSSPVSNIGIGNSDFEVVVREEFRAMHPTSEDVGAEVPTYVVGEEQLEVPEIQTGYEEMKKLDWTYCNTPQFSFSLPVGPELGFTHDENIEFDVRHGVIETATFPNDKAYKGFHTAVSKRSGGTKLHEIKDWGAYLGGTNAKLAKRLKELFPHPRVP